MNTLGNPATVKVTRLLSRSKCSFAVTTSPSRVIPVMMRSGLSVTTIPTGLTTALCRGASGSIDILTIGALNILCLIRGKSDMGSIRSLGKGAVCTDKGNTAPRCTLGSILGTGKVSPRGSIAIRFGSRRTRMISTLIRSRATIKLLPRPFMAATLVGGSGLGITLSLGGL